LGSDGAIHFAGLKYKVMMFWRMKRPWELKDAFRSTVRNLRNTVSKSSDPQSYRQMVRR
jgi:hypothetical protein